MPTTDDSILSNCFVLLPMEKYIFCITIPICAFRRNVRIIKFLNDQYFVFFCKVLPVLTLPCTAMLFFKFTARSGTKTKFCLV